jgi:hypothetical protein
MVINVKVHSFKVHGPRGQCYKNDSLNLRMFVKS